jgi:hypothetical protein
LAHPSKLPLLAAVLTATVWGTDKVGSVSWCNSQLSQWGQILGDAGTRALQAGMQQVPAMLTNGAIASNSAVKLRQELSDTNPFSNTCLLTFCSWPCGTELGSARPRAAEQLACMFCPRSPTTLTKSIVAQHIQCIMQQQTATSAMLTSNSHIEHSELTV